MKTLFLALALLPSLAFAAEKDTCANRGFAFYGKARAQVTEFDAFVLSLKGKKNKRELIQAYLEKHGLPLAADIKKGGVDKSKVDGWIEVDNPSGDPEAVLFTKKLRTPAKSGLYFEDVYLVETGDAKKNIHAWKVPFNSFYPAGLQADELIFHSSVYAYCQESESIDVVLAVKPDGSMRTIEWPADTKTKDLPPQRCQAKKHFKLSDYAACAEILDSKSKKKRVILYEQPMT